MATNDCGVIEVDWRIKGVIQGVLSQLPAGAGANDALQRLMGGRRNEASHIDAKFQDDWLVLVAILRGLEFPLQDRELMEIGTGWLPVLPLCFALAGTRRVHCFDLHRHLRWPAVPAALKRLEQHLGSLADATCQPESEVRARHARLTAVTDGAEILERAGIDYRAPADAAATGLPDSSVSLIFSNSVLEHVPAKALLPIMRESARVLTDDGVALHSVNCGDHYAYFDRSITPIHYLRFDSSQWRRWNNDLLFQNRLRPVDFTSAAEQAGLEVVHRIRTLRAELMAMLGDDTVAPEFRSYPAEELCTTSVTFAARPARGRAPAAPQHAPAHDTSTSGPTPQPGIEAAPRAESGATAR